MQAKKIRESSTAILRLTVNDVENMILEGRMDAPVTTLKFKEEM